MIRDLELRDLVRLESIHNGQYPLPRLGSKLYPVQKVFEVDGKLIGSAYLHLTSEVSLILDQNLNNFVKAEIIREFFNILPTELKQIGLTDTHVFVVPESDTRYAESLKRHFGFVKATGIPLYLGVK